MRARSYGAIVVCLALWTGVATCAGTTSRVLVRAGDIFLDTGNGEVRLTEGGRDSHPLLSLDASTVVFLRTIEEPIDRLGDGVAELRRIDIRTEASTLIYRPVVGLPVLSPDGSAVFFLVRETTTSFQLYRSDLRATSTFLVRGGIGSFRLVRTGPHRGSVLASIRRVHPSGNGFVYTPCLIGTTGKLLRCFRWDMSEDEAAKILQSAGA